MTENRSWWWMEWGQESAGQTSEENGLIDDNEYAKRDIEESLYRARVLVASLNHILL